MKAHCVNSRKAIHANTVNLQLPTPDAATDRTL